ncbi:hypothetical protein HOI83_00625 [Candidatus Uhrbacteria bacterium]|jgi:hypothetical protein|nr:hypothetical protein [Candidatus Uhrbacteria bacterium]
MKIKEALKLSAIPVVIASLCCLSPIIFVLLGISTVTFAASLSDTLYGTYKWLFRGAGVVLLSGALWYYFYNKKGICTLDQAKRQRRQIVNTVLLVFSISIVGYIVFLYGIVEYIGVALGLWEGYF